MAVTFSAASAAVSAQALDLISSAFTEAGIQSPAEPLDADMSAWGLEKLQRLIDWFNAKRELIYNVSFSQFNLIANHAPHTIGPAGDFNLPNRPVRIEGANFILNPGSANPVDRPIRVRDDDWWQANPVKSQTSSIITDLFYSPDIPVGQCNFWPICTVGGQVRLEMWTSLTQAIALTTQIALPAAYWDAVILTLAMRLCPGYDQEISPSLMAMQKEAMKAVLDNNDDPPRIDTSSGMPSSGGTSRPDFNFLTGLPE